MRMCLELLSTAVAEIKQFAEDEALFSAWTKEHRARAAGAAGALPLNTNLSLLTGVHCPLQAKQMKSLIFLLARLALPWTRICLTILPCTLQLPVLGP